MRNLILILGDQLTLANPALKNFDAAQDCVLMIEALGEGKYVWSHKARIALFLSAMRHFCNAMHRAGFAYDYVQLGTHVESDFAAILKQRLAQHRPEQLVVTEPGEWRMLEQVQTACAHAKCALRIEDDTHFMASRADFAAWAGAGKQPKKELRLEYFYRQMRKRYNVLMQSDAPEGGEWNFDADNRAGYPKSGPGLIPPPLHIAPDSVTQQVFALVEQHFPDHPGTLDHFLWPVTREDALAALEHFITHRLPRFGPQQDAMWTDTPFGWHAVLSSSLNLHLLDPREVISAAEAAYRAGKVPLASAEGFIRQILGWREFIRGVYWLDMPQLKSANHYGHTRRLPKWYWSGQTHMACMRDAIGQTLKYGYAHHIQRLMVTGQFGVLAQLLPQEVCDWYLAVYVDAIEWVELPNTAGMALFANGGRFTSKPYIASGQYIKRMSNYCSGCRYRPDVRTGATACPMTTLFWNFLDTHEQTLLKNPRTVMMAKNITRLPEEDRAAIRTEAGRMLNDLDSL